MLGNEFIQNHGIVPFAPQDLNGAATGSNWVSMANFGHATAIVMIGETAGATAALTLKQATDNAATGAKTLAFSKLSSTGQKLNFTGRSAANFSVGETVSGLSSYLTAEIYQVSSDHLIVRCLTGGTTWTTGESLSGGTSGATATLSGTGQDEDTLLPTYTAPSSTFTIPAVTFKTYVIEVEADSLDIENGFDHIQVNLANPGTSTIGGGIIILSNPRFKGVPMPSALGTKKIAADTA